MGSAKEELCKNVVQPDSNLTDEEILLQLDGRPSIKAALPIGFQHVFAMFMGNLAPILIVTSGLTGANKVSTADVTMMVQCAMVVSGVSTLIQINRFRIGKFQIGSGLPMVMGSSFAFVPIMQAVGGEFGIPGILGSALVGSLALVLMGLFIVPLQKLFPPVVVGAVLITIGLNLLPTGVKYMAGGVGSPDFGSWQNILVSFIVVGIITIINRFGKGMLKNLGILIGIAVGYIIAIPLGLVDFSPISQASWIALPQPFYFKPTFDAGVILSFAAIYLVVGLENLGNMSGVTNATMDRNLTDEESSGGILASAVGSAIGAVFNTFPNSAFGQNAGIVSMSKVVNRFCIAITAVIILIAGFLPKLGTIFSSMPYSVLGGAVISVFAIIFVNGVRMVTRGGLDDKKVQILCLTFGLGYGFGVVPEASAQLPAAVQFMMHEPVIAVFVVGVLANLLFSYKTKKEKAMEA